MSQGSTQQMHLVRHFYQCISLIHAARWIVGLPRVMGRYGWPKTLKVNSYYTVWSKDSMNYSLLNANVEDNILLLFPNVSNKAVFDSEGKLLREPVILLGLPNGNKGLTTFMVHWRLHMLVTNGLLRKSWRRGPKYEDITLQQVELSQCLGIWQLL